MPPSGAVIPIPPDHADPPDADGPSRRSRREQAAGGRLPYARHVDDATIETRDGRLLQVLHLAGYPFETADTDELNYRKQVRETMLRGVASSRFALYHHVIRREVSPRLEGDFDDGFSAPSTPPGASGWARAGSMSTSCS